MDAWKMIGLGLILAAVFLASHQLPGSWRDTVATSVREAESPPVSTVVGQPRPYPRMSAGSPQEYLIERFQNGDPYTRARAIAWLALRNTPDADRAIQAGLEDQSPKVRTAALETLARKQSAGALAAIVSLARRDDACRAAAVAALDGYPPHPEIRALLVELASDPDAPARLEVAAALRKYPPVLKILPILVRWFGDPSREVRWAVRDTLPAYHAAYPIECLRLVYEQMNAGSTTARRAATEFLVLRCRNDQLATEAVLAVARKPDLDVAEVAHKLLIQKGEPRDVPLLIATLHQFNDLYVAENLLNSGNPELEAATRAWAKAHDVQVQHGGIRQHLDFRRLQAEADSLDQQQRLTSREP